MPSTSSMPRPKIRVSRIPRISRLNTPQSAVKKSPPIDHPPHYNAGRIEVIDAIEAWNLNFHLGNVVKYIARADHKGAPLHDLQKAAWYLNRHIQNLQKKS